MFCCYCGKHICSSISDMPRKAILNPFIGPYCSQRCHRKAIDDFLLALRKVEKEKNQKINACHADGIETEIAMQHLEDMHPAVRRFMGR